jgi:hypothetical protein
MENVPPALQAAMKKDVGDIALPNEKFDMGDVVVTGRSRRLIFIWNAGRRWVVATEQGGRIYSNRVFSYELSDDREIANLKGQRIAVRGTACSAAAELMAKP